MTNKEQSPYLTTRQLATRWGGWHPESIRRLLRQRRLEFVIIGGRKLIPLVAVERYEQARSLRAA